VLLFGSKIAKTGIRQGDGVAESLKRLDVGAAGGMHWDDRLARVGRKFTNIGLPYLTMRLWGAVEDMTAWLRFPARLIQLRKALGLTQQELSDAAQLHVNQIRRYEAGSAQPTLDALIRLAKVLHVRLDDLVFGDERGPCEDLALQFEAVSQFTEHEKQTVRELLEGMILKHEARRWSGRHRRRTQIIDGLRRQHITARTAPAPAEVVGRQRHGRQQRRPIAEHHPRNRAIGTG
jgi:transcriptional regulator with XRE-family HTH domain